MIETPTINIYQLLADPKQDWYPTCRESGIIHISPFMLVVFCAVGSVQLNISNLTIAWLL